MAFPADLLDALRCLDETRLRPRAVLHVHLHETVLRNAVPGVARVEGIGPMLGDDVVELLGHTHVTVQPVLDLAEHISTNAYEHPETLRNRIHLTTIGDYFPYASSTSRDVDLDHPTPYDPQGPPGQTGTHNAGPLTRTHHRIKTHGGWTSRQTGPGSYAWRSPHGHHYLVDHRGTHPVPPDIGSGLLSPSPLDRALAGLILEHRAQPAAPSLRDGLGSPGARPPPRPGGGPPHRGPRPAPGRRAPH